MPGPSCRQRTPPPGFQLTDVSSTDFATCPNKDAGADFKTAGASYTTCDLELAPSGAQVTGASYSEYDSTVNTAPRHRLRPGSDHLEVRPRGRQA